MPYQAFAASRSEYTPHSIIDQSYSIIDSGASDVFAHDDDEAQKYVYEDIGVNTAGGVKQERKRNVYGEIIIPDTARQLIPAGQGMLKRIFSTM